MGNPEPEPRQELGPVNLYLQKHLTRWLKRSQDLIISNNLNFSQTTLQVVPPLAERLYNY